MKQMSSKSLQVFLRKQYGLYIISEYSHGGGNRDHRVWNIEWSDGRSIQIELTSCSGRFDGKAYCRREARLKALSIKAKELKLNF